VVMTVARTTSHVYLEHDRLGYTVFTRWLLAEPTAANPPQSCLVQNPSLGEDDGCYIVFMLVRRLT